MYTPKSATTAGLLGIFLGAFGAHDWYLENRQRQAILHLVATAAGVALFTIVTILRAIASSGQSPDVVTLLNNIATILYSFAWLATLGSVIWGIIDGVLIITQGDAGLKARGYYIKNDPDNPLAGTLSTTTVRERAIHAAPPAAPTTSVSMIEPAPRQVTLPNAPTLEQQGSNVQNPAQPIVFRASDIRQPFQFSNVFDNPTTAPSSAPVPPPNPTPTPDSAPAPNPAPNQASPATTPSPNSVAYAPAPRPSVVINQPFGTKTFKDFVPKIQRKLAFNPVITRRIAISVAVAIVIVVAGFVIKSVIDSRVRTGYGATYRAARDLSAQLAAVSQSPSCQYVVDSVDNANVAATTYERYVAGCSEILTKIGPLVTALGDTPAIGWDTTLAASFAEFRELYDSTFPDAELATEMSLRLDAYQTWHEYLISADRLTVDSPQSAITQTADILRNSHYELLAEYGQSWLSHELDYLAAYQRYEEAAYDGTNLKDNLRREMEQKRLDFQAWVDTNHPDLVNVLPIATPDTQALSRNFATLYERIKRAYAQNYDNASGYCDDRTGTIYCQ